MVFVYEIKILQGFQHSRGCSPNFAKRKQTDKIDAPASLMLETLLCINFVYKITSFKCVIDPDGNHIVIILLDSIYSLRLKIDSINILTF